MSVLREGIADYFRAHTTNVLGFIRVARDEYVDFVSDRRELDTLGRSLIERDGEPEHCRTYVIPDPDNDAELRYRVERYRSQLWTSFTIRLFSKGTGCYSRTRNSHDFNNQREYRL